MHMYDHGFERWGQQYTAAKFAVAQVRGFSKGYQQSNRMSTGGRQIYVQRYLRSTCTAVLIFQSNAFIQRAPRQSDI